MRLGIAKVHHEPIAKVLRDMPLKAVDHRAAGVLIRPDHVPEVFGIKLARERRRVHQVAKQHRELAALALSRAMAGGMQMIPIGLVWLGSQGWAGQERATGPTELERRWIVTPTLWTASLEGGATGPTERHPRRILQATARAAHRRLLPHVMPRGRMRRVRQERLAC
jgi:hypothetical protein